ncbi:hypothetical protein HPB50_013815 [Hyalomma asiaticum]|uniref:Uncharacterized protein n=1 Tax=Hyalomma asiaticum TaxID=266040 RepID=A0ACB7T4N3_HYAAI|nr:hypothetical protein HPB50_013815 [Hyalomma asiaticum]
MHDPRKQGQELPPKGDDVSSRKRSMTLDLNSDDRPEHSRKQGLFMSPLKSPELNMLQLASPELELFIAPLSKLVSLPTLTPTALFSPTGPEEQEQYACGIVEAFAQRHREQQPATRSPQRLPPRDTTPASGMIGSDSSNDSATPLSPSKPSTMGADMKDETSEALPRDASPSSAPVDMRNPERAKLEERRLRNRIAASKCRQRKLDRISQLEEEVRALRAENSELRSAANYFRVHFLRAGQELMRLAKNDCQPTTPPTAP